MSCISLEFNLCFGLNITLQPSFSQGENLYFTEEKKYRAQAKLNIYHLQTYCFHFLKLIYDAHHSIVLILPLGNND